MAIDYDEAKDLHGLLEPKHQRRHQELHALRRYWQGDYWADAHTDRAGVASVSQLFRDLKGNQSDFGPDLKLVHNILQEVCVKYQTFLSPVPMIKTFIDPPYSDLRREQATKKERVLYGTWGMNRMPVRMSEIAWYLPLMGDCFTGIWPDYKRSIPRLLIRSPEIAHPVKSFDGQNLDAVMFRWEADERTIKREYPNFQYQDQAQKGRYRPFKKANAGGDRKCEILEYSDESYYGMWAGNQKLKDIQHDFGFNLFGQMSFIQVPGEDFNHGAVEQIVSMVEMGNALGSLLFQATLENVFPTMVITNPSKAPEEILRGPGSVIPVNEGGRVDYLTPPVQALPVQVAFLKDNQDKILEASGMPRVNFGQAPTSSVATGKAINELQGAGTGSTVEMVQGVGIGPELVSWNEKALTMYQTVFKDDKINLYGAQRSTLDINPRNFSLTFKGSDIIGSPRNEVVFSPHLNDHEKLVMGLQELGGNLVSKKYVREQLGITDNDAMVEEILQEQLEEGVLGALMLELQQDPSEQHAQQLAARGTAVIEALPLPTSSPHPLLAGPPPVGGPAGPPPGGPVSLPGAPGQVVAPPLPLPQGSPPPVGAPSGVAPAPAAAPGGGITLEQAHAALDTVQLKGKAWLVGEIVAKGSTQDAVEIAVTVAADKQALQNAASFPVVFHMVAGEPNEQFEPIGGGQAGGQAPPPEQLLAA